MTANVLSLDYFTEDEVAAALMLKPATLAKNRSLRKGHPPFIKIGARVFYPKKKFHEWLNGHLITEKSDAS